LQRPPGPGDPRRLLLQSPRRGEPDHRARLAVRGQSAGGLPDARQPAEERRPLTPVRRALPYLLLAAALAGVLALRGRRVPARYSVEHEVAPVAALAPPGRPVEAERGDALGRQGGATARRSLPPSLAGTVADGELAVDESGRLVVTRETRRFFDYFLAGGGEEGVGRAKARLVAEVRKRLPVSAVPEAIGLLDRYLAYRRRAGSGPPPPEAGRRAFAGEWRLARRDPGLARAFLRHGSGRPPRGPRPPAGRLAAASRRLPRGA